MGLSWQDISLNGKQECILYGNLYTDYEMITDSIKYKTSIKLNNPIKSQFGDVLIPASDTTPVGLARATCIEKSGVWLGSDINIIRPSESILGSFLSINLNANRHFLIKLITGTTVKHIRNSEIKKIKLFISKKSEQKNIVRVFKMLNSIITLHQRKYEKLMNLKKALLKKMFPTQMLTIKILLLFFWVMNIKKWKVLILFWISTSCILKKQKNFCSIQYLENHLVGQK